MEWRNPSKRNTIPQTPRIYRPNYPAILRRSTMHGHITFYKKLYSLKFVAYVRLEALLAGGFQYGAKRCQIQQEERRHKHKATNRKEPVC